MAAEEVSPILGSCAFYYHKANVMTRTVSAYLITICLTQAKAAAEAAMDAAAARVKEAEVFSCLGVPEQLLNRMLGLLGICQERTWTANGR